jgi:hypothetical protein
VTSSLDRRDEDGSGRKGSSGNPEGRRAELAVREVVTLARTATVEAVNTLREIAADTKAPARRCSAEAGEARQTRCPWNWLIGPSRNL